jgi:hypothetical protein
MKKLSFGLVALLAIVFAVSSFTTKEITTKYHVYGVTEVLPLLDEQDWDQYLPEVPEMVEAQENPITSDPGPFDELQSIADFSQFCESNPEITCLIQVKVVDNSPEVVSVLDGEFQGF